MAFQYYGAYPQQQQQFQGLQYPQQQQQQQQQDPMGQMSGLLSQAKDTGLMDDIGGLFGGGGGSTVGMGTEGFSLMGSGGAGDIGGGAISSGNYSLMGEGAGLDTGGFSLMGESGGAAAGGEAGGLGAMGIGAIVAAAIAAQHGLSEDTSTTFEGVETGDAFSGQFGTEPWMGWVHDKLDLSPTAGEKFDAAVKNDDWELAFKRSFEMSDYWADPASSWIETGAAGLGMDEEHAGWMFNPIGELLGGLS